MDEAEPISPDIKLRVKYRRITTLLLVIAILFTAWSIAVVISVFTLNKDAHWAYFSPTEWIMINIGLVSFFLFVNIILFSRYRTKTGTLQPKAPRTRRLRKKKAEKEPAPEMLSGHEVFTLTLPMGAKGGIFSKTFIPIDDQRVLQLRYQMIPPTLLWPPEE